MDLRNQTKYHIRRCQVTLVTQVHDSKLELSDLMEDLYTNTVSCVQADGVQSDWFPFSAGVRHGCNVAPDLFLEPMDWIMNRTVHRGFAGISIGSQVFTDLDFCQ